MEGRYKIISELFRRRRNAAAVFNTGVELIRGSRRRGRHWDESDI